MEMSIFLPTTWLGGVVAIFSAGYLSTCHDRLLPCICCVVVANMVMINDLGLGRSLLLWK